MSNFWPRRLLRDGAATLTGEAAHQGTLALIDQALVSGTNFLTRVIIGRTVAREEFGLYLLGFTIITLLVNAQTSLISTPYTVYSAPLEGGERARYAGSTLIGQLALSALAAILLAAATGVLSTGAGPEGLGRVVGALALVAAFVLLREFVRRICFAHLRMRTAFFVDLCVAIVQLGGLALLASAGLITAPRAFLVAGLACAVAAAVGFLATRGLFASAGRRVRSDLARNWRLGRWMFASTLAATAGAETYPWLLAAFHGVGATGIFAACSGVVFLANPFLMGMTNFLGPRAAHARAGGLAGLDRLVIRSTIVTFSAILAFFAFVFFLGGPLLELLYGPRYAGYGAAVAVLALRPVVSAVNLPVNCALMAIERADILFKGYLAGCVVTIVLGVPLVHSFGLGGAVWGIVAATAATSAYRLWSYWMGARKELDVTGD